MKRVPITAERIAAALQAELEARPELTHAGLAKSSGLDRSVVTRMFQGSKLTIDNLDALTAAMGLDWHDLIDAARGEYKPRNLRADLEEVVAHIADLRREKRGRR